MILNPTFIGPLFADPLGPSPFDRDYAATIGYFVIRKTIHIQFTNAGTGSHFRIVSDRRIGGVFFSALGLAPSSKSGSRLRSLAGVPSRRADKQTIKERLEQALDPISRALPLSADETSRARTWLIQAGYREQRHLSLYVGSRVLLAVLGMITVVAISGFNRRCCW